jgi:hypothetical protein
MEKYAGSAAAQERFLNKRILAAIYQIALRIRGERNRLELFIRWAAGPVIGGIKPSSMVRLPREELGRAWKSWGEEICRALDISAVILRQSPAGSLLLLYRRRMLQRALKGPSGRRLRSLSYPVGSGLDPCLAYLASRFADPVRFPHEVGIFLGYPLEDVIAFCGGKLRPYDCRGYWKVYHRPEKATRAFAYMDRARVKIAGEFFPRITKAIAESALPHTSLGNAPSDGIG